MKFIIRSSEIQQLSQVPVTAIHPMADAAAPADAPAATAAPAATGAPAAASTAAASTAAPATGEGMDGELGILIVYSLMGY